MVSLKKRSCPSSIEARNGSLKPRRCLVKTCFLFVAEAFLSALITLTTTPACASVALADFARTDSYDSATLSPSGKYVALRVPLGNQFGLAVFDISQKKIVSKISVGMDRSVSHFDWASDSRIVLSLAQNFGSRMQPLSTGELLGIDVDGGNGKYLFGFRAKSRPGKTYDGDLKEYSTADVITSLESDPDHVLIRASDWTQDHMVAYRLNVITGELDQALTAPMKGEVQFLADHTGFIRYAVGSTPLDHENIPYSQAFIRTPEHPEWLPVPKPKSGNDPALTVQSISISRDDRYVYLSSDEGEDRLCLIRQDLQTGDRARLACDDQADLEDVVMSFDGTVPIAAVFQVGAPEIRMLPTANPAGRLLMQLQNQFPGEVVLPVSQTRNGQLVIISVHSDRNPGDYYLLNTQTKQAQYLIPQYAWIDPSQMGIRQPIEVKARDGQAIHGYLTLPPNREAHNLPLVVNPHGGPFNTRDNWAWDSDPQMLASRGYAVLQVNFRGSSGYGRHFADAGKQQWDTVMIDDITDATHWVIAQGLADARRVGIYGASYGGYAAMMSAIREPSLYRCAIGYAGLYDLKAWWRDSDPGRKHYLEQYAGATLERLLDASPIAHASELQAPVMLVHGGDDLRVPISQALAMKHALTHNDHPVEWMEVRREGHGFYGRQNREDLQERLVGFLDLHLAAPL